VFFGRLSLSRAFSGVVVFVGWFLCFSVPLRVLV